MREILFRGKRVDNGEWDCGNLFDWGGDGSQVAIVPFCEFARYANWEKWLKDYTIPVFPETVGQYTGLKDKNGRPCVQLYGGALEVFGKTGCENIYLSVSHERNTAVAFSVIE